MTRTRLAFVFVSLLLGAATAGAQQRPLVTQDPEVIGAGRILVEGGLDYSADAVFPVSGLRGDLLRVPLLGVVVGLSSIADLEVVGGLHNHLAITERVPAPLSSMVHVTGDTTSDVEDVVVTTKIRFFRETRLRPGIGVSIGTRLPIASNESGLGTDTFEFYVTALAAKTVRSTRIVLNVGGGILADAVRGDLQNDVVTGGLSLARAMTQNVEVVGELNGRVNTDPLAPIGTDSRGTFRLGARYTRGPARVDAAVLFGMTSRDPDVGFTVGFTYIFNGFKVE